MDPDPIAEIRRFNRTVTQELGVLHDRFLQRDRPLGEARVLWEIGPDGADVRALRSRLDLDSGYLSRVLRALEAAGMVTVGPSSADRRVRTARLTAPAAANARDSTRAATSSPRRSSNRSTTGSGSASSRRCGKCSGS